MKLINQILSIALKAFLFIKQHRFLFIIVTLSIITIIIALTPPPPSPTTPTSNSQPIKNIFYKNSNSSSPSTGFQNLTEDPEESTAYFINRIDSLLNVTGYSWSKDHLIYSTPTGIYKTGTNQPLLKTSIDYITWSWNGTAVYQHNNKWFIFTPPNQSQPLPLSGKNPLISPNGQHLVAQTQNSLNLVNLQKNYSQSLNLSYNNPQPTWSLFTNNLAFIDQQELTIVPTQKDSKPQSYPLSKKYQLLALSPEANQVALAEDHSLLLLSLPNNKPLFSVNFTPKAKLKAAWLNSDKLIIIETVSTNDNNHIDDFIWEVDSTGQKKYLANSMPILNRLNLNHQLFPNPDLTTLPLIENQYTLWVMALTPNQFPNYGPKGLHLIPISSKQVSH